MKILKMEKKKILIFNFVKNAHFEINFFEHIKNCKSNVQKIHFQNAKKHKKCIEHCET